METHSNHLSIGKIKMILKTFIIIIIVLSISLPSTASIRSDENKGRLLPVLDVDILEKLQMIDKLIEEIEKRLQILPKKSLPLYDEEEIK
jgi:hypothetical protein